MTNFLSRLKAMSGQEQSYYESGDHPSATEQRMSSLFARPSSQRRWLTVSEYGVSEPVSIKNCTHPNIHQYFISSSKNTTKRKKSCSDLQTQRKIQNKI
jgi:hypothetical protein